MVSVPVARNTVGIASVTDAKLQPADFGAAGEMIGASVARLGQEGSQFAEQQHQYQELAAHTEAAKLNLFHQQASTEIGQTVKEARGENAGNVANQAAEDLRNRSQAILSQASPRARKLLEPEIGRRVMETVNSFRDHAFVETQSALVDNTHALNDATVNEAATEPDNDKAFLKLDAIHTQNATLGAAMGWSSEVIKAETQKSIAKFVEKRADVMGLKDPQAAIDFATLHRTEAGDDAYSSIVSKYSREAGKFSADARLSKYMPGPNDAPPAPADPLAPSPKGGSAPTGKLPVSAAWAFTAKHEGGYAAHDANGAPVNFGINQSANPGVDVRALTKESAGKIFEQKYWNKSGAADLPPALAAVHSDTYYINPAQASKFLRQAGGDAQKYMDLRENWMRSLVQNKPGTFQKYDHAWSTRNADLRQFASSLGGGAVTPHGQALGASASIPDIGAVVARIEADTTLSPVDREETIAAAKTRIAEMRQSRSTNEDDAARQATDLVVGMGAKGFTSTAAIPNTLWQHLAPSMRETLQNRAETNKKAGEEAPLTPELETLISFTRLANPQKFISPAFQQELLHRGAPASAIRSVAREAGDVAGRLASQKPDPISGSEVWTIAKPAFESAGIFLDHQEAVGKQAKIVERQADAVRKSQAIGFLRDVATTWAQANPGKKPDESLIKGWVGQSLRRATTNPGDKAIFEGDPHSIVTAMSQAQRHSAITALKRSGVTPTEGNVYRWYKNMLALHTQPVAQ